MPKAVSSRDEDVVLIIDKDFEMIWDAPFLHR